MARKVGTPETAEAVAVRLLAGRETFGARLRAQLEARGFSETEISAAVARVTALGYLDDARAAKTAIRTGLQQGLTPSALKEKLSRQGIDEAVLDAVLRELEAEKPFDAEATARALLAKRKVQGARAARLLASRGFEESLIRRLVPSIDAREGEG